MFLPCLSVSTNMAVKVTTACPGGEDWSLVTVATSPPTAVTGHTLRHSPLLRSRPNMKLLRDNASQTLDIDKWNLKYFIVTFLFLMVTRLYKKTYQKHEQLAEGGPQQLPTMEKYFEDLFSQLGYDRQFIIWALFK